MLLGVRFKLLTAVSLNIILWNVELCQLVNSYRSFIAPVCFGSSSPINLVAPEIGLCYVNSVGHYRRVENRVQSTEYKRCGTLTVAVRVTPFFCVYLLH